MDVLLLDGQSQALIESDSVKKNAQPNLLLHKKDLLVSKKFKLSPNQMRF